MSLVDEIRQDVIEGQIKGASAKVKQAVMTNTFKGTTMGDVKYQPDGTAIFPCAAFQWSEGQLRTVRPLEQSKVYKVKVAPPWDKR